MTTTTNFEDARLMTKNPFRGPVVILLLGTTCYAIGILMFCYGWLLPRRPPPILRTLPSRSRSVHVSSTPIRVSQEQFKDGLDEQASDNEHVSFSSDEDVSRPSTPAKKRLSTPRIYADLTSFCARSSTHSGDGCAVGSTCSGKSSQSNGTGSEVVKVERAGSICSSIQSGTSSLLGRRRRLSLSIPLPSRSMFKPKHRKPPAVERHRAVSDPCTYSTSPATPSPLPRPTSHVLVQRPPNAIPQEVFRTTFVNPFRIKPRRSKTMHDLPSAREAAGEASHSDSVERSQRRRPSAAACSSPSPVPRTQPYASPRFARSPTEAGSPRKQRKAVHPPASRKERNMTAPDVIACATEIAHVRPRSQSLVASTMAPASALKPSLCGEQRCRETPHRRSVS
ncbi:hypothetical protein B0H21DRAFT_735136 [Amylocystis lapponica]|nr:hypothetical protein B0H21DRAFT_735136 [Amylocystis lapponica]